MKFTTFTERLKAHRELSLMITVNEIPHGENYFA
jgi:hypothetical protein